MGMNATDLEEGGEEFFLPIAITLAIFVPEAEDWLEWNCSPAGEGPAASAQPWNSIPEGGKWGHRETISFCRFVEAGRVIW